MLSTTQAGIQIGEGGTSHLYVSGKLPTYIVPLP